MDEPDTPLAIRVAPRAQSAFEVNTLQPSLQQLEAQYNFLQVSYAHLCLKLISSEFITLELFYSIFPSIILGHISEGSNAAIYTFLKACKCYMKIILIDLSIIHANVLQCEQLDFFIRRYTKNP